jgi:5-methylcytosine-specific restriction endonuclease McrA
MSEGSEWLKSHPEKHREYQRRYAEKNREALRRKADKWDKEHPDRHKARSTRYSQSHREDRKASAHRLYVANKELSRINKRNRRARIRNTSGTIKKKEWEVVLLLFGNKCLKCGSTDNLTMDHVIPLSLGGSHTVDNVQPLCFDCNRKKSATIADYRVRD